MAHYNQRVWLNKHSSSSTGSIVCYSGNANWTEEGQNVPAVTRFVEVADCHNKIRIHQGQLETLQEFINKVELMQKTLSDYLLVLRNENEGACAQCLKENLDKKIPEADEEL